MPINKMKIKRKVILMKKIMILKISINNREVEKIHLYTVKEVVLNKLKGKIHYKDKNKQMLILKNDRIVKDH